MALVFRIIVNKKKSVTHCQQVLFIVKVFCVDKVFIALFVEHPLCHDLHLHMLKTSRGSRVKSRGSRVKSRGSRVKGRGSQIRAVGRN